MADAERGCSGKVQCAKLCQRVPPAVAPTRAAPTATVIQLHGVLARSSGGFCNSFPNDVANVTLTFRDGNDQVIGTATTDTGVITEETPSDPNGPCDKSANYSVELPIVDFYQVEIPCVDEQLAPVSFEQLRSLGFVLDLTLSRQAEC